MSSRATFNLELARIARRERTYWLRTVYVAFLSTVVALAWLAKSTGETDWSRQEHVGHSLFVIFAWVQFVLLNLAAPLSLCGAISEERNRRTLPLLLSSPLSSLDIVLGKLFGGLIPVGLLLLAGLPIMFLLLVFGGLSPWEVISAFALTIACATLSGAAALFFSSITRTTYVAFGLTAGFVAAYVFVPRLLLPDADVASAHTYTWNNVFAAFNAVLSYGHIPRPLRLLAPIGVALGIIVVFLLFTAVPLRRLAAGEGQSVRSLRGRWRRLLQGLGLGRRARREPVRPGSGNPITARELGRGADWLRASVRITCGAFLLLGAAVWMYYPHLYMAGGEGSPGGHRWFLPLLMGVLVVLPLLAGARAFALEWERNTMDLLLASSLSNREILVGKLGAVAARMGLLGLVPLAYAVYFARLGALPTWAAPVAVAEWSVYGLFLMTLAVLSGLLVKRASRIVCAAAGLALGFGALLIPVWLVGQVLGVTGTATHAFLPWWVLFGWAELLGASAKTFLPLLRDLVLNLSLHLLAAGLLVHLTSRFFGRLTGRVT